MRFKKEKKRFQSKWAHVLQQGDPYYNPNLSLSREDFSLSNVFIKQEASRLIDRQPGKETALKRAAIFAHFDRDNIVDDYVIYYLQELKKVCNTIIFVSASDLSEIDLSKIKTFCNKTIIRDNIGYDFLSWKIGIQSISNIEHYDEILICNDSVYGPFFPLDNIFTMMNNKPNDFWGMTDNHDIKCHIQSYFVVFKKNILGSRAFKDFWDSVKIEPSKDQIIKKYEIGLTQLLISSNFKPGVYVDAPSFYKFIQHIVSSAFRIKPSEIINKLIYKKGQLLNRKAANQTLYNWKNLIIKKRMPFLKIELLRDNPLNINIDDYENTIRSHSSYDIKLVLNHLERVGNRIN